MHRRAIACFDPSAPVAKRSWNPPKNYADLHSPLMPVSEEPSSAADRSLERGLMCLYIVTHPPRCRRGSLLSRGILELLSWRVLEVRACYQVSGHGNCTLPNHHSYNQQSSRVVSIIMDCIPVNGNLKFLHSSRSSSRIGLEETNLLCVDP